MSTNLNNSRIPITFDTDEIKDALVYSSVNNILNASVFLNQNALY